MKLADLLVALQSYEIRGPDNMDIQGIHHDSQKVEAGSLFVGIPGTIVDGKKFVPQAVKAGASAVVFEGPFFDNLKVTQIRVLGARLALAHLASTFFVHPTKKLYLSGVTGTNGKTTLTYLLEALWQAHQKKTGVIGTINTRFGSHLDAANQTTPESRDVQELFSRMVEAGVQNAAMEVSSHSSIQQRIKECHFDSMIFTNLSQDHLDFHGTMEEYYLAKEQIFTRHFLASQKLKKRAVIFGEDDYGTRLSKTLKALQGGNFEIKTYGMKAGFSIFPKNFHLGLEGIKAQINLEGTLIEIQSPLMGRFNLFNIMASILVGVHSQIPLDVIVKGINQLNHVPGRMERIQDLQGGRFIYVDYAHTPDALKNILESIKPFVRKKVVIVFGCGGDRDPTKRPLMGYEVARLADACVVTSDNPRTENPSTILRQILPGLIRGGMPPYANRKGYLVLEDRKKAIAKALEMTTKGDVLIVSGKGHEDYQILGKEKIHFSDQEIIRELI